MTDKILIFGGTGFLGRRLSENLVGKYHIIVATRNKENINNKIDGVEYCEFSYNLDSFVKLVDNKNIIVNFSGASIADKRWTAEYKKIMYDSRINTTALISEAINFCGIKPRAFISTSATGIYGDRGDELLYESSAAGSDFLSKMCLDWEREAFKALASDVRTVCIRVGVVLDKNKGGFKKMIQPFKFFVGGRLGSGEQYLPWIHIDDIINIYTEAIKNNAISGVLNGTAPSPVKNVDFSRAVAETMKRPNLFPVPEFMLKILLGEFAEFLTSSQRAIPEKLMNLNFKFKYTDIFAALRNLIRK